MIYAEKQSGYVLDMRRWWGVIGVLAGVRVAIAVADYAGAGSKVSFMPRFVRPARDGGLEGDATGFYAGAREFMASWGRMPHAVLALTAVLVIVAAAAIVAAWRKRPDLRPWLPPAALLAVGLAVCVGIHWMRPTGAAVIGWPLVWAAAMLPARAVHLTKATGWDIGTGLSLVFSGLGVVATGYLGRNASGRAGIGLVAAGFYTAWPLLVGVVAGHRAWANDQWFVGVGLHNYDEPLSTLLVTAAAALLVLRRPTPMQLGLAGCALSFATSVKVSNAIVAALALAFLVVRFRRAALPFLAGALAFAPVVLAYWPLSYPTLYGNRSSWPSDPFDFSYVVSSWTHSSVFTPHTLAIITPLAVVGVFGLLRPWQLAFILAFFLVNPIFYSFFANTAEHPRFMSASLPELFVLSAAGLGILLRLSQTSRSRTTTALRSRLR
jgi:hypothetical protein